MLIPTLKFSFSWIFSYKFHSDKASRLEAELRSVRTKLGMEVARLKGARIGRPMKLSRIQAKEMVKKIATRELTPSEAARLYKVDRTTVYDYVKRYSI